MVRLCWLALFIGVVHCGYEAPDDCQWNFVDEQLGYQAGIDLTCHLSAINSKTEKTNFSVIPSDGTRRLTVLCSDHVSISHLDRGAFASLSQLEQLSLEGCRLEHLPPLAFEGLTLLTRLTIRTPQGQLSLAIDALVGMPSLQHLDLAQNMIKSLPPDELCHLSGIKHLNLSHNQIRSMDDLGLRNRCLQELTVLDLSGNELTSLKSSYIHSVWPELRELQVRKNLIRFLEPVAPGAEMNHSAMCSLKLLDLSDNHISSLPNNVFQKCSQLVVLNMANNSLSVLNQDIFDGLMSLEVLDLAGNLLSSSQVSARLFRDLTSLVELSMGRNQLEQVSQALFTSMHQSLQILRLSSNKLSFVPPNTFSNLSHLKELDLSFNALSDIEAQTLSGLTSVTHLLLGHNRIRSVQKDAFAHCGKVLVLDLSHNRLERPPTALAGLNLLQTLDLSQNLIEAVNAEDAFLKLKTLWRLQLNGNRLSRISHGLFVHLEALQILDLSSNKITQVEQGSLDSNRRLQAVRLDDNLLQSMSGVFQTLDELIWLNMSSNHITEFDYSMLPKNLKWLDLSRNRIRELGNYFDLSGSEIKLSELDISFNLLELLGPHNIPDSVETLLLNDNKISQVVPYTFFKKNKLLKVDLTVNHLKSIDKNSLRLSSDMIRLPDFYLTGNPIECNCDMLWFKSINSGNALHNYPMVKDIESIYCRLVDAREQAFVPLVETDNEQFLCPYTTHCFSLCQCCDFDACDCEMSCPDDCTCFHDSTWSKNIAVCSSSSFRDLPDQLPMDATEIYLDGNIFPELNSHTFIGRKNLRILHLNNSQIHTVQNKTFNGLKSLNALYLHDNQLTELKGNEFDGLQNLRELHLQNNFLTKIANNTFSLLTNLEILNLNGNRLVSFPVWQLAENALLISIKLAENLWSCECGFVERFRDFLRTQGEKVEESGKIKCITNDAAPPSELDDFSMMSVKACVAGQSGNPLAKTRVQELAMSDDYLPPLAATLATFAVLLLLLLAVFVYRKSLRVWFHARYGVRLCHAAADQQLGHKIFDAFVSYCPKDDVMVREMVSAELEGSFRLCLYHRDLPTAPNFVADTILRATEVSKRTVVVMSHNFLKTEWARYDYKSGFHQAMRGGNAKRLIVILMDNLSLKDIDPDLRLYLKTGTVLNWNDKYFWPKLRYALPDPDVRSHKQSSSSSSCSSTSSMSTTNNNSRQEYSVQPRYSCSSPQRPSLSSLSSSNVSSSRSPTMWVSSAQVHTYSPHNSNNQSSIYGGGGTTNDIYSHPEYCTYQPAAVHI